MYIVQYYTPGSHALSDFLLTHCGMILRGDLLARVTYPGEIDSRAGLTNLKNSGNS